MPSAPRAKPLVPRREAAIFKALGHPARLQVVNQLAQGERCVFDLVELTGLGWSTVSRHLTVLKAVGDWVNAWAARDEDKYIAAYDASFVPQGGGSRDDWEKRRRLLLSVAKNIELKVDSPSVERAEDGSVTVTFNQFYRSDSYRDAVVKQLRMVERDGRWLIVEERVLSNLRGVRP